MSDTKRNPDYVVCLSRRQLERAVLDYITDHKLAPANGSYGMGMTITVEAATVSLWHTPEVKDVVERPAQKWWQR